VGGGDAPVRTFLIADIRGYTRLTQEQGDDLASELAARFAVVVRAAMPHWGGELLELRGDEALCVFASARQALGAAVDLQRRFRSPGEDGAAFPLGVGIGLDAGEAVPVDGGYRGGALNLAARLCGGGRDPGQRTGRSPGAAHRGHALRVAAAGAVQRHRRTGASGADHPQRGAAAAAAASAQTAQTAACAARSRGGGRDHRRAGRCT